MYNNAFFFHSWKSKNNRPDLCLIHGSGNLGLRLINFGIVNLLLVLIKVIMSVLQTPAVVEQVPGGTVSAFATLQLLQQGSSFLAVFPCGLLPSAGGSNRLLSCSELLRFDAAAVIIS